MKRHIILTLILLFLTGSTLFYQWKVYSSNNGKVTISANEVVYMKHVQGQIQIKQVIKDLPNQLFKLKIPDKLNDIKCNVGNNQICSLKSSHIEVEEEEISFTYTITTPKQKPKSFLLEDWLIQLEGVDIQSHKIQLSEFDWKEGSWVGNTRETTKKKMDLLDYYYLEGLEKDVILYWQQKPLHIVDLHDEVSLFSTKESKKMGKINYRPFSEEPLYLILTDQHKEIKKDRLWIMPPEDNGKDLQQQWVIMDIENAFLFKSEEEWLAEVLAAVILGEPPKDSKAKKMYTEIDRYFSIEQVEEWKQMLRTYTQKQLKSRDLDLMLSEILGGKIRFFTHNTEKDQPFSPLIQYDSRKVRLNGKDIGEFDVFHKNDKWLMDVLPLLKALDFQTQIMDQNMVQADKGKIHYRFYPNKRFFDLNGQRYGIGEAPVIFCQETILMEIPFIHTLFNVEIEQDANTIHIKEK
ncbi:hypothetical protein [Lederbergia ruris]|uniref:hypothetical protein n=1 Tax=Lederbergia ruris TaxID=217495 RepID=UPI00130E22A3